MNKLAILAAVLAVPPVVAVSLMLFIRHTSNAIPLPEPTPEKPKELTGRERRGALAWWSDVQRALDRRVPDPVHWGAWQFWPLVVGVETPPPPDHHELVLQKGLGWAKTHRITPLDVRLPLHPDSPDASVQIKYLDLSGRVGWVLLQCKAGLPAEGSACQIAP